MKKFLVFTDLDGTLLTHDGYSWQPAVPALMALAERNFPVVFTSSKTTAELLVLREEMNNTHPFISENGAVVNIPLNYFPGGKDNGEQYHKHYFASAYDEIIATLQELRERFHFRFQGFNDMSVGKIAELTRLELPEAELAKQREASEPLLWQDSKTALNDFERQLDKHDLVLTAGGRFHHVMSRVNKGDTVKWLLQQYQQADPQSQWITVGLGDSFNDIPMLEVVDYPVFINNPRSRQPDVSHIRNLQRPQSSGPAGWNQAILGLMTKLL